MLSEGMRVVLILGGTTIFLGGLATLWRVRRILVALGHADHTADFEAVTQAFRSYRRSVSGEQLTEEMNGLPSSSSSSSPPPPPPPVDSPAGPSASSPGGAPQSPPPAPAPGALVEPPPPQEEDA